jgi:hypothetical protein
MGFTLEKRILMIIGIQPGYHFKYAMQCHNPKAVASMIWTFTEARESVTVLKFDGNFEPAK